MEKTRGGAMRAIPFLPILLTLGACVTVGLWFGYMTNALAETKRAAYVMLMPVPPVFLTVPALFIATLVGTIVISFLALALSVLRRRRASGPYAAAAGVTNLLLFLLALWLAGMLAITALWAGAAMVSEKSTADAAATLKSVDPEIHRLIFQASGGAINGTETGFIVSIGDPKGPRRDVDIGKSSCSLFCFVFARAMMSDSNECYCNGPIMLQIHDIATYMLKTHLMPGAICVFATLVLVLGLLVCGAAQFGGASAEARASAAAAAAAAERSSYKVYADAPHDTNVILARDQDRL